MLNSATVKLLFLPHPAVAAFSLFALITLAGCSGKSESPTSTSIPKIAPSPALAEDSALPPPDESPEPLPSTLGTCENAVMNSVDEALGLSEEALIRYDTSKQVPSRENFKLAYTALTRAQATLQALTEQFPAIHCTAPLSSSGEVRTIDTAKTIEEVHSRVDSPAALILENHLN